MHSSACIYKPFQNSCEAFFVIASESSMKSEAEHRLSTPTPDEDPRKLADLFDKDKTPSPIRQDMLPSFQIYNGIEHVTIVCVCLCVCPCVCVYDPSSIIHQYYR